MSKILSFEELQKRVRIKQASMAEASHRSGCGVSGDSCDDVNDPRLVSESTRIPSDPSQSDANHLVPNSARNRDKTSKGEGSGKPSLPSDPNEKGQVSIPSDPSGSNKNQIVPEDGRNEDKNVKAAASALLSRIQTNVKSATSKAPANSQAKSTVRKSAEVAGTDVSIEQGMQQKLAASKDVLANLGSALLDVEGGVEFAEKVLKKKAGMDAAKQLIKSARAANEEIKTVQAAEEVLGEFLKRASVEEVAQLQQVIQVDTMLKSASAEDIRHMQKLAAVYERSGATLKTELEKRAYDAGAGDAAQMMDAGEAGALPQEGEEIPQPSIEEIIAILEQLVQSGQIDEQTAMQIAQELMGQGAGVGGEEAADETAAAEVATAQGAAPEEAAMAGKSASVANRLLKKTK